jgi:hypothetical protein
MIAALVLLAIAGGFGCGLAWWRGWNLGYTAALNYRAAAAEVDAGTLPVNDTEEA